jgi:hypothetical protein
MVDRKFVEAADALRFEMVNAHDVSFAPFVDRSLKDKIEAYDTARSRLAAAQLADHPESIGGLAIGGLASRTPASKQGKKALDDMLLVFAKHDDDEEDCWTQPARRGVQYVSDLEWDLETQVRLASHRAEANESLRIMLSNLAAYTGTHFGPDEPLKNYERVRKTLTDKPEPPSIAAEKAEEPDAPGIAEAPDGTLPCVYCSNENLCVEIRDDKHPGMLGFSVRCGSAFCGARGPVRPAQMDAVEEWNRAYRWVHPPKAEEPAPSPQAQGEVCECGHIAAIHDDPHGDGAHGGSCLEIIGKCSDGSDDFCCCSEFHHAQ